MGSSAAAKKAWASRRRGHSGSSKPKKSHGRRGHRKSKGGGMPENVKNYFKWINAGKSKTEAKRLSGMGKAPESSGEPKKNMKTWGPGHPLYDWQHKRRG